MSETPDTPPRPTALMFSGGKDSVAALQALAAEPSVELVSLVATIDAESRRVPIHDTRAEVLALQARSIGLPLEIIELPPVPDNRTYTEAVGEGLAPLAGRGIVDIAFGDLFLEDIRTWREAQFETLPFRPVFPLWDTDRARLADSLIDGGLEALICCIDSDALDESLLGRHWDHALLAELPETVDPFGENGEFHTLVVDGPSFSTPVRVRPGARRLSRGRFRTLDLRPG